MLNRTSTQRWALKTSENSAESHQVYREGEGPLNCSPENTLKNGCSDTHKHYESTSLISIQFSKCELQKTVKLCQVVRTANCGAQLPRIQQTNN